MLKINRLSSFVCLMSLGFSLNCQATTLDKKPAITQVDLDQIVMKGREPSRQDIEGAKQAIKLSRRQQNTQAKKEAKQVVSQLEGNILLGELQLKDVLKVKKEQKSCSQCKNTLLSEQESSAAKSTSHSSQNLIIFVSSNMPPASLKALFWQAQSLGIPLVFRGLIENSFIKTKSFFEEQQINGEIDPVLFEEYRISEVPTFVMRDGNAFDLLQGNISLQDVLTIFKNKGELKEKAAVLFEQMKVSHS